MLDFPGTRKVGEEMGRYRSRVIEVIKTLVMIASRIESKSEACRSIIPIRTLLVRNISAVYRDNSHRKFRFFKNVEVSIYMGNPSEEKIVIPFVYPSQTGDRECRPSRASNIHDAAVHSIDPAGDGGRFDSISEHIVL